MQVYFLKYKSISQKSYFAIIWIQKQPYLVSAIDIQHNILNYIYIYSKCLPQCFSASYYLIVMYHLYYCSSSTGLILDVLSLNIKGISLYLWLNYQLIMQRTVYDNTSSKYNLTLTYSDLPSRNYFKRYLVFRYIKY